MIHIDGRPIEQKPLLNDTLDSLFDDFVGGAIDASIWGTFISGTGSVSTAIDDDRGSYCSDLRTGALSGSRAALYGIDDWQRRSGDSGSEIVGYDNTSAVEYLVMEFEAKFFDRADMNNADVLLGFAPNDTDDRSSDDVSGFILNGDELAVLTDLSGTETVTAVPGTPDIETQLNHYRMYYMAEKVIFMFNHSVVAVHTTNLANDVVFPIFLVESDVASTCGICVTNVSIGYSRYPNQNLVV